MTKEGERIYKKNWARENYWKKREQFLARNKTPEGRAYKAKWARENRSQSRGYNNLWIKQNRINWLKKNGPCKHCGSSKRLEVDHLDPSKKIEHKIWSWSVMRRDEELKKCQVLCFLCHRLKTNKERGWKIHGEVMYQKGCRCAECKRVHAKKLRTIEIKKRKANAIPQRKTKKVF